MPRKSAGRTQKQLVVENEKLRARLDEAQEVLRAIRNGEVDALIVSSVGGEKIFTLKGADYPYRVLIEDMSEGALILTSEGVILYANRCFAKMLKAPLEKVIGSAINGWMAPERQRVLQSLLRKGIDEKRREQLVFTASDETLVPVYLSVNDLHIPEMPDSFCLVVTDLTEQKRGDAIIASEKLARELLAASNQSRLALLSVVEDQKQAEEAMRASEKKYRLIADNVSDVIWIMDTNLKYTYISPSIQRLRGYSVEETMALALEENMLLSLATTMRTLTEEGGKNQQGQADFNNPITLDLELSCNDGSTVWVENKISYLYDSVGRLTGYLGISREITERRRLQQELNESQQEQIRTKDRFVSHVSHELRSPLASIYQFTTILLDGLAGVISPEQREFLEIVLRNVQQLRSMVDDLLVISSAAAGKLIINTRYIVPAELIKGIVATFRLPSTKVMHLLSVIPSDLPPVLADPARVREVLINLLDNAMKFTPANGSIAIQAEIYNQDPNFLCIKVSDTGCGISSEEIQKIFDYLYQVEGTIDSGRKGLGLGLYICKELISRHGGRIWAENNPGCGSTFFFTLPIFSLSRFFAPIMTGENMAVGSIAIVTVEVFPVEKRSLTNNDELALQEAWNAVYGCTLPSKDVILPLMPSAGQGAVFCVVLCVNQLGAKAFVRRIEEHLQRCQSLQNAGLSLAISISMLELPAGKIEMPFKKIIRKIVDEIGEQTKITF